MIAIALQTLGCLVVCGVIFAAAIFSPSGYWHDDGDCTSIVWHTLRIPSQIERIDFWRARVSIVREYGERNAPLLPFAFKRRSTAIPPKRRHHP